MSGVSIFIDNLIENSWDKCDEGEYLTINERDWLVSKNALQLFVDTYFVDLVERYQGSCSFLAPIDESFLEEFDLFSELDDIIFECTGCGWWFEAGDDGEGPEGEHFCSDCSEDWLGEKEE